MGPGTGSHEARTGGFRPGTLEAVGFIAGRPAARHAVRTPGAVHALTLAFDLSGRPRDRALKDVVLCHASFRDAHGTVVPDAWENVAFGVTGGATLVGSNPLASDAGISSILVETEPGAAPAAIHALAIVPGGGSMLVLHTSQALEGMPPRQEVRYTTDGSEPGSTSPLWRGAVEATPRLRAALLVRGQVVASLAADAPKSRIPPSAAPDRRGPFRR